MATFTIPAASTTTAGVMTAADKTAVNTFASSLIELKRLDDNFSLTSIGGKTSEKDIRALIGTPANTLALPCVIKGIDGSQRYAEAELSIDSGTASESMANTVIIVSYMTLASNSSGNADFHVYRLMVPSSGLLSTRALNLVSSNHGVIPVRGKSTLSDLPFSVVAGGILAYTDENHSSSKILHLPGILYRNIVASKVSNTTLLTKTIQYMNNATSSNSIILAPGACVMMTNNSSSSISVAANADFVTLRASSINTTINYMAEVSLFNSSSNMVGKSLMTAAISGSIVKLAKAIAIPASGYISVKFYPMS